MGISRAEALDCLRSDDLIGIGMEADAVRRALHPEGVVTYLMGGVVRVGSGASIAEQVSAAAARGASDLRFELASGTGLEELAAELREMHKLYPELTSSVDARSLVSGLATDAGLALQALQDAGMRSISGSAWNLTRTDEMEAMAEIHRAAHAAGMTTEAGLLIGCGDSPEQRVDWLLELRQWQEETGGFTAFTLASFESARALDDTTAVEYLKTLAVCRMVLDNIPNMVANLTQQGLKVTQMGLRFGANDVGAVLAGGPSEEEVRRTIRDAGFRPAERDLGFQAMMAV